MGITALEGGANGGNSWMAATRLNILRSCLVDRKIGWGVGRRGNGRWAPQNNGTSKDCDRSPAMGRRRFTKGDDTGDAAFWDRNEELRKRWAW